MQNITWKLIYMNVQYSVQICNLDIIICVKFQFSALSMLIIFFIIILCMLTSIKTHLKLFVNLIQFISSKTNICRITALS